jgi:hypothetical protein
MLLPLSGGASRPATSNQVCHSQLENGSAVDAAAWRTPGAASRRAFQEALDQQCRAGDEHDRQRDLRRDEARAQPPLRATAGPRRAAGRVLERRGRPIARHEHGWREARGDAGRDRDGQREQQHGTIHADGRRLRQHAGRCERDEQPDPAHREEYTGRGAGGRQDDAFGHELPDQPRAAGADRRANAHLAPA